ncbi:hypothetical protein HDU86_008528 [Geranomyces michiganensis]|nr:hypothetical protein HDU86_008528 [Geranomyces michiganensis]
MSLTDRQALQANLKAEWDVLREAWKSVENVQARRLSRASLLSKSNASIARTTEKLASHVVSKRGRLRDEAEEVRKRVRILNEDPDAEFIDAGPLYWGIVDTNDAAAMAEFLLRDESWQECQSITKAAQLLTCGGLRKLWAGLGGDEALLLHLFTSKDAAYLKRCFEDMALYINQYAGRPARTEHSFDCHAVLTLAKVPGEKSTLNMSWYVFHQQGKHSQTKDEKRFGKKVDFMCHILNLKACFYVHFEFADEIYVMHQYQDVSFPEEDADVLSMLELIEAFLLFRDTIEATSPALTKSSTKKVARGSTSQPTLLAGMETPTKTASEKKAKKAKAQENDVGANVNQRVT